MSSKKRILIVEDERPLAHALELKLQHEGFETVVVGNGKLALDALAESFDVMLLDMMMPVMDGFHVLDALQHKDTPKPYIIVLSNLSQHEDEERVLALGANQYFIKSNTSLSVLVEKVKEITG